MQCMISMCKFVIGGAMGLSKHPPTLECLKDSDFILLLFSVESKETLQTCVVVWASQIYLYNPGVVIILVGVLHCYRPSLGIDQPSSHRCVSEEEGKEAAEKIGKMIIDSIIV